MLQGENLQMRLDDNNLDVSQLSQTEVMSGGDKSVLNQMQPRLLDDNNNNTDEAAD